MKLIDILVKEVHTWPPEMAYAVQDFDRTIKFGTKNTQWKVGPGKIRHRLGDGSLIGDNFKGSVLASDQNDAVVSRTDWREAKMANLHTQNGHDPIERPDIGQEVLIYYKGVRQGTGHVLFYAESTCVVYNNKGRDQCGAISDYQFFVARTEYQLAVEKRLEEIARIRSILASHERGLAAIKLYDAGYRLIEEEQS